MEQTSSNRYNPLSESFANQINPEGHPTPANPGSNQGGISQLPPELIKEIFSHLGEKADTQNTTAVNSEFQQLAIDQSKRGAAEEVTTSLEILDKHLEELSIEPREKTEKLNENISNLEDFRRDLSFFRLPTQAISKLNFDNRCRLKEVTPRLPSRHTIHTITFDEANDLTKRFLSGCKKQLNETNLEIENLQEVKAKFNGLKPSAFYGAIDLKQIEQTSKDLLKNIPAILNKMSDHNLSLLESKIKEEKSPTLLSILYMLKEISIEREFKHLIEVKLPLMNGYKPEFCCILLHMELLLDAYAAKKDYDRVFMIFQLIYEKEKFTGQRVLEKILLLLKDDGKPELAKKFEELATAHNATDISSDSL